MNHCLIQAVINSAPQLSYTKEYQTPIAEMIVNFKGLRSEDPTRSQDHRMGKYCPRNGR